MTNRSINMKRVNRIRSTEVTAMLDFLKELDNGTNGDYDGFNSFGIKFSYKLKGELNSYRTEKLVKLLGKNLSKKHLLIFAKTVDYSYSLTSKEFDKFVDLDLEGYKNYWYFSRQVYISNI